MERETANMMLNHIIDYVKKISFNYIRAIEQGCDVWDDDFREKAQQCTVLYNLHSVYPFIHEDKIADEADRLNSYLELTEDEYILNKGNFGENYIKSPTIPERQEIAYSTLLGLIGTEASLAVSNLFATIMRLAYKKRKEAIQIADTICQPMQTDEPQAIVSLPQPLNTDRAIKAFARAIEKGYICKTDKGYSWEHLNGRLASLGYFCYKCYCMEIGSQLPETAINKLFGVTRVGSALTQADNAKKPQPWRKDIDALFD